MTPWFRKFVLTTHVAVSVGFVGAVAGFLALAIAGLASENDRMVRAAYLAMDLTARLVIVPLSLASLLTGIFQSLGTSWGLFRHYWVVVKLLISLLAAVVLLTYTRTLAYFANIAANTNMPESDLGGLRSPSPVLHASAALLLLLVATTLSVYKPRGVTPYGWRKQYGRRAASPQ